MDLRHRLKLIWAAVWAGQLPAYQARHIATATRHLTAEQTGVVDARIAPSLGAVSFGRLQTLLDAAIYEADPDGVEQQAAAAAQQRFVRLGRGGEYGLKLIIARAAAGDAIWFKATIDRIADILTRHGNDDPVDVRRSKAIGILAQPAQALQLLCQHQDDTWDGSAEPAGLAAEPAQDESDLAQTLVDEEADVAVETSIVDKECTVRDQVSDEATHRSIQITPAPFNPDRARPRAIVYVHLSEAALSAGSGVARV